MAYISRDPFARTELHREKITDGLTMTKCDQLQAVARDFLEWMARDARAARNYPEHRRDEEGLRSFVDAFRAVLASKGE